MDSDRVCDDSFYPAGSSIPYAGLSKAYVLQAEGVSSAQQAGAAGERFTQTDKKIAKDIFFRIHIYLI